MRRTVHPHACGEIRRRHRRGHAAYGSPPRVWGNRVHGVTPASSMPVHPHACGEIDVSCARATRVQPVHPHACGEIVSGRPARSRRHAVHPHACGEIVCAACLACRAVRFTPTRVGKSCRCCVEPARIGGSPPRVWGNRRAHGVLDDTHRRFTPTRVGKSPIVAAFRPSSTVHPHACGEICSRCGVDGLPRSPVHPHACGEIDELVMPRRHGNGSPPRVWGNPSERACGSRSSSVHPHACGEIAQRRPHVVRRHGSPPRVWGNLDVASSSSASTYGSPPRVWGNRRADARHDKVASGSPPRVWGNRHVACRVGHGVMRFTPTRVGKSTGGDACR